MHLDSSDVDLVIALTENDPEAPRVAVARFAPLVRHLLRRSLGPEDDLEDVQQEVFSRLFVRVRTLRDPLSLRAFVMAITVRTALHARSRRQKNTCFGLDPDQLDLPATRDQVAASYALVRLEGLVQRLRERERATFVLRFVAGMTVSEIASTLLLSEATVRRSFSGAMSRVSKWAARDPFLSDYIRGDLGPEVG